MVFVIFCWLCRGLCNYLIRDSAAAFSRRAPENRQLDPLARSLLRGNSSDTKFCDVPSGHQRYTTGKRRRKRREKKVCWHKLCLGYCSAAVASPLFALSAVEVDCRGCGEEDGQTNKFLPSKFRFYFISGSFLTLISSLAIASFGDGAACTTYWKQKEDEEGKAKKIFISLFVSADLSCLSRLAESGTGGHLGNRYLAHFPERPLRCAMFHPCPTLVPLVFHIVPEGVVVLLGSLCGLFG